MSVNIPKFEVYQTKMTKELITQLLQIYYFFYSYLFEESSELWCLTKKSHFSNCLAKKQNSSILVMMFCGEAFYAL